MTAETLYFADLTPSTPYRDAVGRPLAGARLTFWRSGTTEPAPVYTGPTLSNELSTPIEADASGVFPTIYLDAGIDYRVKLEDRHGRLIWDVAPYVAPRQQSDEHIEAFLSSGTFVVPEGVTSLDHVLIVGGGGGAASATNAGGGGGGEVRHEENVAVTPGASIPVTVGAGGNTGPSAGESSLFGALEAIGGGPGGSGPGGDGASGGGGGTIGAGSNPGGTGLAGNDGGASSAGSNLLFVAGGGGGGAGAPGEDGQFAVKSGDGGDGVDMSSIFGTAYGDQGWFGGGGRGGGGANVVQGTGGRGGGGGTPTAIGTGLPNTGGGGSRNAQGGSGIVLVKYGGVAPGVLFLPPVYQATDGRVLPGAELRFFLDSEVYVTHADAALDVPLSVPVRADAGGFFPPIYLGDAQAIAQLKTASGELVFGPEDHPLPVLDALDPAAVGAGSGALTLTVTGAGFTTSSVVTWNGSPRSTTFISDTELEVAIDADDVAAVGFALVRVFNPPPAGGLSNALAFAVEVVPNPLPEITSLTPDSVTEGSGAFMLTVSGTGFVPEAVVRWNGSARPTTFISDTELEAAIDADDVLSADTVSVTVYNPPPGGGESDPAQFTIEATQWTPAELEDLLIWLDADDGSTITITTGAVSQWADKSGNNLHATQGTAANRPTVATNAINDRDALRFDGSNDSLSITGVPTDGTAYSIYAVLKNDADPPANAAQTGIWNFTGDTSMSTRNSHHPFTDGSLYHNFGATTRHTVGNPTPALTDPHLFNVDSASGSWQARLNGTQIFSTSTNTVGMGSTCLIGLSSAASNDRFYDGDIAEIVVVLGVLDQSDREKVEGYLAHKWGITLPNDHPYEDAPPEL